MGGHNYNLYPTWWIAAQSSVSAPINKSRVKILPQLISSCCADIIEPRNELMVRGEIARKGQTLAIALPDKTKDSPSPSKQPEPISTRMKPTVVLLQPPPAHHFSFVKGQKWVGGRFYNRNYLGKRIRRVEKDFIVV